MGLVDETGLQHVCMEAALDLRRARARYAIDNVDWAKCVGQLNKDIKAANAFLSDELKVRPVKTAVSVYCSEAQDYSSSVEHAVFYEDASGCQKTYQHPNELNQPWTAGHTAAAARRRGICNAGRPDVWLRERRERSWRLLHSVSAGGTRLRE